MWEQRDEILHPGSKSLICSSVFAFAHVSHVKSSFFPFLAAFISNIAVSSFHAAENLNNLQAPTRAVPARATELYPKIDRAIEKYSLLDVYKLSVNSDATPLQTG